MEVQRLICHQPAPAACLVLVVDDDEGTRRLLADWLTALGFTAMLASGADEALQIVRTYPVDIALCDICMPGHDGIWLINQLRKKCPETAIIIETGLSQMDPSVTLAPGVAGYIIKPFQYEAFGAALKQALTIAPHAPRWFRV
jgi:DNA-binding NtrC family response regulator